MDPVRSTFAAGDRRLIARMVSNYECGHCTGRVESLTTDEKTGILHAFIEHDDGCPVLAGTLSPIPDTFRAAT
ncbi:hypothetical protein ACWF94_12150 [Streptomyces sp. NPDC055078]